MLRVLRTIRRYLLRGTAITVAVSLFGGVAWVMATDESPIVWRAVWVLVALFLLLGALVWTTDNL